jgi:polyphosphate kinase
MSVTNTAHRILHLCDIIKDDKLKKMLSDSRDILEDATVSAQLSGTVPNAARFLSKASEQVKTIQRVYITAETLCTSYRAARQSWDAINVLKERDIFVHHPDRAVAAFATLILHLCDIIKDDKLENMLSGSRDILEDAAVLAQLKVPHTATVLSKASEQVQTIPPVYSTTETLCISYSAARQIGDAINVLKERDIFVHDPDRAVAAVGTLLPSIGTFFEGLPLPLPIGSREALHTACRILKAFGPSFWHEACGRSRASDSVD